MADRASGDDATLLPAPTPVSGDGPTAASTMARRGGRAVARVARYVLLDKLGEGGMGVVWSAYDPELDRRIAVKLIRGEADDNAKQRFIREARAMAQLHHPAIVAIHDVGAEREHAYIAMELVRGKTLREWLKDDTRPWRSVLTTFIAAGEGIAVAHRAGVVHRDFKPANVMVADDGRAVVLDFGLARAPTMANDEEGAESDPKSWASIDVTHTAGVVGTPAYMAPEQIGGAAFDGRADQFAFCVAAYEALFGVPPFPRDSLPSMVGAMAKGTIAAPVSTQRVPSRVRRALVRGLAHDPAARWPDMDALLAELRIDRGRTWLAVGGGAIAIAATATWIATRPEPLDPCAAKDSEIAQVWTDERRAQVERVAARIDAEGATVEELDAYVGRLRSAVAESCAAANGSARDAALHARAGVCLDGARSELDGLLEVLASESVAATETLAEAATLLPDPAACIDLADAQQGLDASAASVRQLAEAESWLAAGDADRAAELLAPLLEQRDGGPGWRSRVLRVAGLLDLGRGNHEAGVGALTRAAGLALEGGDDLSFVRCTVDLAKQVGLHGGDFARGEAWLELGMASARRLGGSPLMQARLLEVRGALRKLGRDFEGAVLSHVAALAITMATVGPEHRRTGEVIAELGVDHLMDARYESALPLMTDARRILEKTVGPRNAEVMRVRTNTLSILTHLGRYADTEREARELVALLDVPESSSSDALASALTGLAEVARARDDAPTTIEHYERVRAICMRSGAQLRGAAVLAYLARLYYEVGRHADAEAAISTARSEALAAGLAPDHSYMVEFELRAADVAAAAGDFARAHAMLDAVAERARRNPDSRIRYESQRARVAVREGKPGNHAAAVREFVDNPDYSWSDRVEELLLLADLERLAGDEGAAIEALDRARSEVGDREDHRLLREIERRRKP